MAINIKFIKILAACSCKIVKGLRHWNALLHSKPVSHRLLTNKNTLMDMCLNAVFHNY